MLIGYARVSSPTKIIYVIYCKYGSYAPYWL